MKTKLSTELALIVLAIIPLVYLFYVWPQLPETVPTHFGIDGKPNDYSSKQSLLWILIAMNTFLYLLLRFVPYIDPRKRNYEAFWDIYIKIRIGMGVFFCFISFEIIRSTVKGVTDSTIILGTLLAFFAFLGNYLTNVKPNFFVGVRTPWTIDNEVSWRKTHRLIGRLWFYGSLAQLVLMFFIPKEYMTYIFTGFTIGSAILGVVYSFVVFKKETQKRNEQSI